MIDTKTLQTCFHCGLNVNLTDRFCDVIDGEERLFCCPACNMVAKAIIDGGMKSYYQFRTASDTAVNMDVLSSSFDAFNDIEFQQRYVLLERTPDNKEVATVNLLIGGLHCAACVWLLENYISRTSGVKSVNVSLSEQKATLQWYTDTVDLSTLCQLIAHVGYQPEPFCHDQLVDLQQREHRIALRRLGVAGIAMMQVGMFAIAMYAGEMQSMALEYKQFMRWISLLVCTPVVFYSAAPFFIGAWRGLKLKSPGMDLPVAIAIALAYFASAFATIVGSGHVYFDSVAMFTFFLLGGRYLEMRARHYSGRLNSKDLNSLLPSIATKISGNANTLGKYSFQSVPLFKIKRSDKILIKPGQIIPVDGLIIDGSSDVNESQITGEFMPHRKSVGDRVIAGSLNGENALSLLVEAVGSQLQIQTINRLLDRAQIEKPTIAQWADRIASYFVIAILIIAVCTYFFWWWHESSNAFWIVLSVLVVSCPCALSLATPAALVAATSFLRQQGMLVTASHVWDALPKITHVVFDKTGTLTEGRLKIVSVDCQSMLSESQCLDVAAALEVHSDHPIASAFVNSTSLLRAEDIRVSTGRGIQGTIDGKIYRIGTLDYVSEHFNDLGSSSGGSYVGSEQWVFLSNQRELICKFLLQDTVRKGTQSLISSLKSRGMQVHMLSGDSSEIAQKLSVQLGLNHCIHGATPEGKLDYIQQLQKEGHSVLMVGDGINDIPVLAAANISIAMCHASNLAKTHADCILLTTHLDTVLVLINLAQKTQKTIRQNFIWALTYNFTAIPLAAMALIAPYVAAIGMSLSSLVVVLNALYLQVSAREV